MPKKLTLLQSAQELKTKDFAVRIDGDQCTIMYLKTLFGRTYPVMIRVDQEEGIYGTGYAKQSFADDQEADLVYFLPDDAHLLLSYLDIINYIVPLAKECLSKIKLQGDEYYLETTQGGQLC